MICLCTKFHITSFSEPAVFRQPKKKLTHLHTAILQFTKQLPYEILDIFQGLSPYRILRTYGKWRYSRSNLTSSRYLKSFIFIANCRKLRSTMLR
jgi:hypothetical protein